VQAEHIVELSNNTVNASTLFGQNGNDSAHEYIRFQMSTHTYQSDMRSTLRIDNITVYDAGMYMCVAGNSLGTGRPAFAWLSIDRKACTGVHAVCACTVPLVDDTSVPLAHVVAIVAGTACVVLVAAMLCLLMCVHRDRQTQRRKRRIQHTQLVYGKTIRVLDDQDGDMLTPPKVQVGCTSGTTR
jgi:hypothetical protein